MSQKRCYACGAETPEKEEWIVNCEDVDHWETNNDGVEVAVLDDRSRVFCSPDCADVERTTDQKYEDTVRLFDCNLFDVVSFEPDGDKYVVWQAIRLPSVPNHYQYQAVLIPDQPSQNNTDDEIPNQIETWNEAVCFRKSDPSSPRVYRHEEAYDDIGSQKSLCNILIAYQYLYQAVDQDIDNLDIREQINNWVAKGNTDDEKFEKIVNAISSLEEN